MSRLMQLSFQIKSSKIDNQGKVPVYARITMNGVRTEFSIKRRVDPQKWICNPGMLKGSNEESKSINAFLGVVRLKINDHYRELIEANRLITPLVLKNAYFGQVEKGKTLVDVFKYHNNQVREQIGMDFAPGTYERYCTALSHIQNFLHWKYNADDIEIKNVGYEFISEFEYYLKTKKSCSHNTATLLL